ncbi:MAG: carboxymuconolactone decarboxylase family protein [Candidatus Aenigmarchaeota archaeon]|nr:carboxymuconolactone decarboxylase family protein [Candidatus Aenigmarchaeota archaeon]
MEKLYKEIGSELQKFSKRSPEKMEAFANLMKVVESEGALSVKHKELIAVSLSINAHCQWCIAYHVKKALENGATKEEIVEASWIAILMGGGPSLMYFQLVDKAMEEFAKK